MQKTAQRPKAKTLHLARQVQHYVGNSHLHLPRKLKRAYSKSLSTVKHHPYQAAGLLIGLSALTGALLWLGLKRKED